MGNLSFCHTSVAYWYISINTLTKMSKNGGYPTNHVWVKMGNSDNAKF